MTLQARIYNLMKHIQAYGLMILLLSSCTRFGSEQKTSIKEVIDANGFNKPCWLGVEPGMDMEAADVEVILGNYYGEQNAVINTVGLNPTYGYQRVIWRNDTKSDSIPLQHGGVTIDPDGKVHSLQVFFHEQWFTVGDLISSAGEPDLVVIYNFNNHYDVSPCSVWMLHYPDLGFSVHVWLDDEHPEKIEKSDFISYIGLSKPWLADETAVNEFSDKLVNWNGYGDYSQYCEEVITPSP